MTARDPLGDDDRRRPAPVIIEHGDPRRGRDPSRGRSRSEPLARIPWLGVLLVLVGVALLIQQFAPGVQFASVVFLGLGLLLAVVYLTGRARWALLPALLVVGYAVPRLLVDLGVLRGSGWSALGLTIALGAIWVIGRRRGGRYGWALWLGLLLALYAATQLSGQLPGVPDLSALWPILVIGFGVYLLATTSRADRGDAQRA